MYARRTAGYDITSLDTNSGELRPIEVEDQAWLECHEVTKAAHYYLSVNAMMQSKQVREDEAPYGGKR